MEHEVYEEFRKINIKLDLLIKANPEALKEAKKIFIFPEEKS